MLQYCDPDAGEEGAGEQRKEEQETEPRLNAKSSEEKNSQFCF